MGSYNFLVGIVEIVQKQIEDRLLQIINKLERFETNNEEYLKAYADFFGINTDSLIISWWYDGHGVVPFFLNYDETIYCCYLFNENLEFLALMVVDLNNLDVDTGELSFLVVNDPKTTEVEFIAKKLADNQKLETIQRQRITLKQGLNYLKLEDPAKIAAFRFLVFTGPRPWYKKIGGVVKNFPKLLQRQ